jgi:hypothetical protein
MKMYTCFGTGGNDYHACAKTYRALLNAGYTPKIEKVYGSGFLPKFLQTKGRKKIYKRTGNYFTPVLELDDGTIIDHSENIIAWAQNNPAK